MSKRRDRGNKDFDAFEINERDHTPPDVAQDEAEDLSFQAADRAIYGGPLDLGKPITGNPIRIELIQPDPMQPRRAIPHQVRQHWNGDMSQLFNVWEGLIRQESSNNAFTIVQTLKNAENGSEREKETSDKHTPDPIEVTLRSLIDLAASIRRDGLLNPITVVVSHGNTYFLETGERRLLAYHLLWQYTHEKDWQKIPAQIVEEFSVWRQASENNARDDLNAIGKARQVALLLFDLWVRDERNPIQFQPFNTFQSERGFYAQAADLSTPYGKGPMLLNGLGMKNMSTLSRYRDLLGLPEQVWYLADDYNVPEGALRDLIPLSEEEQIKGIQRWYQQNFANGKDSSKKSAAAEPKVVKATGPVARGLEISKEIKKITRAYQKRAQLKPKERQQYARQLDTYIDYLNHLKADFLNIPEE